jgi:hypothetical protein
VTTRLQLINIIIKITNFIVKTSDDSRRNVSTSGAYSCGHSETERSHKHTSGEHELQPNGYLEVQERTSEQELRQSFIA